MNRNSLFRQTNRQHIVEITSKMWSVYAETAKPNMNYKCLVKPCSHVRSSKFGPLKVNNVLMMTVILTGLEPILAIATMSLELILPVKVPQCSNFNFDDGTCEPGIRYVR